jgi:rRNA maturation protein Nop10
VEVEEPRCACGYLLYQLAGDTCPECGRAVAAEDRWSGRPG